jgi:hypothetical protein
MVPVAAGAIFSKAASVIPQPCHIKSDQELPERNFSVFVFVVIPVFKIIPLWVEEGIIAQE